MTSDDTIKKGTSVFTCFGLEESNKHSQLEPNLQCQQSLLSCFSCFSHQQNAVGFQSLGLGLVHSWSSGLQNPQIPSWNPWALSGLRAAHSLSTAVWNLGRCSGWNSGCCLELWVLSGLGVARNLSAAVLNFAGWCAVCLQGLATWLESRIVRRIGPEKQICRRYLQCSVSRLGTWLPCPALCGFQADPTCFVIEHGQQPSGVEQRIHKNVYSLHLYI